MVEHRLPKPVVAGSIPVSRSKDSSKKTIECDESISKVASRFFLGNYSTGASRACRG
jgi:hypothetical protein